MVNEDDPIVTTNSHMPNSHMDKVFASPRRVGGKVKTPGTSNMPRKVRKKEKTPSKYRPAKNIMSDSSFNESVTKQPIRIIPKPKTKSSKSRDRSKSNDRKLGKKKKTPKYTTNDDIFDF